MTKNVNLCNQYRAGWLPYLTSWCPWNWLWTLPTRKKKQDDSIFTKLDGKIRVSIPRVMFRLKRLEPGSVHDGKYLLKWVTFQINLKPFQIVHHYKNAFSCIHILMLIWRNEKVSTSVTNIFELLIHMIITLETA